MPIRGEQLLGLWGIDRINQLQDSVSKLLKLLQL
jgi:hypothetical protein